MYRGLYNSCLLFLKIRLLSYMDPTYISGRKNKEANMISKQGHGKQVLQK